MYCSLKTNVALYLHTVKQYKLCVVLFEFYTTIFIGRINILKYQNKNKFRFIMIDLKSAH